MPLLAATTCPDSLLDDVRTPGADRPPTPDDLTYSLTLPASATSPAIARRAVAAILQAHGLRGLTEAAVLVTAELAACAYRFTPTEEVYLRLRHRDGALRVIVYDGHPRHTNSRLAEICDERRGAALNLMACVVRACAGDWGFGEAREPGGGTRMWAVVPGEGARAYGMLRA
ncbi:ATP-binding protein [Streptomyces flavofungini]|uniref:ATP-binding protein n=1 Tax=Streptomyces flavofungini TaxID=68200 RepID=UPI0025B0D088|nr:ATP-binding protein [Streptomyces flavofungini]WJV46462.1 ATP-binding protein [Streptomyces flavofungini]